MPNREWAHFCVICSRHGEFSDFGAGSVSAQNHGAADGCAIGESGDHAVAAFVESNVGEGFAILKKKEETSLA
jgi:hypothetical protein